MDPRTPDHGGAAAGRGVSEPGGQFSATGRFRGSLDQADPEKQKAFVESIASGSFLNEAAAGAESALSAMLGRTAAYAGSTVRWDELIRSNETYDPGINLNKLA